MPFLCLNVTYVQKVERASWSRYKHNKVSLCPFIVISLIFTFLKIFPNSANHTSHFKGCWWSVHFLLLLKGISQLAISQLIFMPHGPYGEQRNNEFDRNPNFFALIFAITVSWIGCTIFTIASFFPLSTWIHYWSISKEKGFMRSLHFWKQDFSWFVFNIVFRDGLFI